MNKRLWIGRYFGIDLYLHWSFFVLLAGYGGYGFFVEEQSILAVAQMLAVIVSMFACVTLHEYGHALAARLFGVGTRDITMLPIGGLARLERMPREPWQEMIVAVAGPAVNVVIAVCIVSGLILTGTLGEFFLVPQGYWHTLLLVNVVLVLFNMLPAFPMDGGRVLRAFLALILSYRNATFIASRIGMLLAIVIGIGGSYLSENPVPLLVGAFVFWAAGLENRQVVIAESVSDVSVAEVMSTTFRTLSVDTPLEEALTALSHDMQGGWPVEADGHFVGMIDLPTMTAALDHAEAGETIGAYADHTVIPATPVTLLTSVIASSASFRGDYVPVVDEAGHTIGIVELNKVAERIALKNAARR